MTAALILAVVLLAAVWARGRYAAFIAQRPENYATTTPVFDMTRQMAGPMISEGLIYGPTGRVAARFVARMQGDWIGGSGTLEESFHYATGNSQHRKWTITMGEGGRFTATAPDVIGVAQGWQSGATVRMTYRIRLEAEAGGHALDVTDWLYLMENGTILNRSEMRRFGLRLAELIATIRPGAPDV